jgi:hypothetical protein
VLVQQRQDIRPLAGDNPLPVPPKPSYCDGRTGDGAKDCEAYQFSTETGCVNSCQCGYSVGACMGKSDGSSCYQNSNCTSGKCEGGRVARSGESPTAAVLGRCANSEAPPAPASCFSGWTPAPSLTSSITCDNPNLRGVVTETQNTLRCQQCRERQRINAGVKCTAQQGCICGTGPDQGKPKQTNQTCAANAQIECYRPNTAKTQCEKTTVSAASCNPTTGNYPTQQACGNAIGNPYCFQIQSNECKGYYSTTQVVVQTTPRSPHV